MSRKCLKGATTGSQAVKAPKEIFESLGLAIPDDRDQTLSERIKNRVTAREEAHENIVSCGIGAVKKLEAVEAWWKLSGSWRKLGCCRVVQIGRFGTWKREPTQAKVGGPFITFKQLGNFNIRHDGISCFARCQFDST